MMRYLIRNWVTFQVEGLEIYMQPEKPTWLVPTRAGYEVLQKLRKDEHFQFDTAERLFLERLEDDAVADYPGRSKLLQTDRLNEMWFHITNRCNLACRHCLVSSGPDESQTMAAAEIVKYARQGYDLGVRIFALTGGEPFIHPEFETIVDSLLTFEDTTVVILTNGLLLDRFEGLFDRWPPNRLHVQVSLDGKQSHHDAIRGTGSFAALEKQLGWLRRKGLPFTLSMCVVRDNVDDMPWLVEYAAENGSGNIHYLWYFVRGRADNEQKVDIDRLFASYKTAAERAEALGVNIDNVESLKSQVFAPPGTRHDGTGAGWESLAVGPDGMVYPTPAMVGVEKLATPLADDLKSAWLDSHVLQELRSATVKNTPSPLRYILGGGDSDHSYVYKGDFIGHDPYVPLHEKMALWLIAREARRLPEPDGPGIRLKMGDILESCGSHGAVSLVHNNCLLAVADVDGRTAVKEFYGKAVEQVNDDILNPVCYPDELITHIPAAYRFRGYGCGSPALEAGFRPGETVVDLGCGPGVECFVAAREVGPRGKVIGIDMLDSMIARAREGGRAVADNLGYDNLEFKTGYLETLPLEDNTADVIMSNCVINLSVHKRKTFLEIFRVLKPGGRLVVSDVICETDPGPEVRNDDVLRGECLAGALTQRDLFGILAETGFVNAMAIKRFPYRKVKGHPFYSMTFQACKLQAAEDVEVMYRGPMKALLLADGTVLPAGQTCRISASLICCTNGELFRFDSSGQVQNLEIEDACGCNLPPETSAAEQEEPASSSCCYSPEANAKAPVKKDKHVVDCMVCGAELAYLLKEEEQSCYYCGSSMMVDVICESGHYVCDSCHLRDSVRVIETMCLNSTETDMIKLMDAIRRHECFSMHGPDHHAMVPGIVLAAFRNSGGEITDDMIRTAISRGSKVSGGSCAFLGACGGALGLGAAFGVILQSNPLNGQTRHTVMKVTNAALDKISELAAPRCCQRDCYLTLKAGAELSKTFLPIALKADYQLVCRQTHLNRYCSGCKCLIHPQTVHAEKESLNV